MRESEGLVVARHRRHVVVEDEAGELHSCLTRGRALDVLVGDRVAWHEQRDGTAVASRVQPRESTLTRVDARGRREAVAANLTQLLVVAAAVPEPDPYLLDRYLAAAELVGIEGIVVFNKVDLLGGERPKLPAFLGVYETIGYRVHSVSAHTRRRLEPLESMMQGGRSAMVGQSGVGKSSLINALLGEDAQPVGGLIEKGGGHGRHTTTAAALFRLPNGGELIDSPGVRNYAPYIEEPSEVVFGYREFAPHLGACRFADCRHRAEPGCAVKGAVDAGSIDARRYDSYCRFYDLVESLRGKREAR